MGGLSLWKESYVLRTVSTPSFWGIFVNRLVTPIKTRIVFLGTFIVSMTLMKADVSFRYDLLRTLYWSNPNEYSVNLTCTSLFVLYLIQKFQQDLFLSLDKSIVCLNRKGKLKSISKSLQEDPKKFSWREETQLQVLIKLRQNFILLLIWNCYVLTQPNLWTTFSFSAVPSSRLF